MQILFVVSGRSVEVARSLGVGEVAGLRGGKILRMLTSGRSVEVARSLGVGEVAGSNPAGPMGAFFVLTHYPGPAGPIPRT
jgi:hypothetical protein